MPEKEPSKRSKPADPGARAAEDLSSLPPEPAVDTSLEAALAEEHEKAATYLTRLKYLAADFENYQKRVAKELDMVREEERQALMSGLLPIVDELELAVESGQQDRHAPAVIAGVQVVLKKLHELLQGHSVVPIIAQGARFDPTRHTAVERVPTTTQPEGTVLEEVRRGYMLGDKVLRPTMAKVAVAPAPPKPTPVEEIGA